MSTLLELLKDLLDPSTLTAELLMPNANIFCESSGRTTIHVPMPGVSLEDIDIVAFIDTKGTRHVLVTAARHDPYEGKIGVCEEEFKYVCGLRRCFHPPPGYDIKNTEAHFDNGMLTLVINKELT
jgi:HSP20 family molecular chaperone IbpA